MKFERRPPRFKIGFFVTLSPVKNAVFGQDFHVLNLPTILKVAFLDFFTSIPNDIWTTSALFLSTKSQITRTIYKFNQKENRHKNRHGEVLALHIHFTNGLLQISCSSARNASELVKNFEDLPDNHVNWNI